MRFIAKSDQLIVAANSVVHLSVGLIWGKEMSLPLHWSIYQFLTRRLSAHTHSAPIGCCLLNILTKNENFLSSKMNSLRCFPFVCAHPCPSLSVPRVSRALRFLHSAQSQNIFCFVLVSAERKGGQFRPISQRTVVIPSSAHVQLDFKPTATVSQLDPHHYYSSHYW